MNMFNLIVTRLFDAILRPFHSIHPMWGLATISVLTGAAMVWVFGRVSNQAKIRKLKSEIKGRLLEVWLFRENVSVVLKAQCRTFWLTAKYAFCSLRALVILMIPVIIIMIQLQARYAYRPLQPGESTIVKITYANPVAAESMGVELKTGDGLVVETPLLRVPEKCEVHCRIRAAASGQSEILVNAGDESVGKIVQVGNFRGAMSPLRSGRWFDRLLNPAEPGMPKGDLASVEVKYPSAKLSFMGVEFHWMWPFFILSIAAGFALKGVFKVEL